VLRHNLRCSTIDGSFYMLMLGLAETFFPLFILALFKNEVASGLIATLPIMLASVLQLLAPTMVARIGSFRMTVSLCAGVQTLACPLLALIAWRGAQGIATPMWLVFVVVTMYHAGATVGGSPWTSMMGVLVPARLRASFFARRTRTLQLAAVVAVVAGAALLDAAPRLLPSMTGKDQAVLAVFALLFLIAGLLRGVSTYYLWKHIEPAHAVRDGHKVLAPRELVERLRHDGRWRLILALAVFWCGAMVGSPFWSAYVREIGHASFLEWAGLIVIWFLGKALAAPWAGLMAQRHGRRWLLIAAGVLMVPVPILWALSTNLVWLAVAQLIAGAAIAAWELATWLVMMETFREEERTSLLAKYGLVQWCFGVGGSMLGGLVLARLGQDQAAFVAVFLASAGARAICTLLLHRTHRSGLPKG
jgi:MFS family permease